MRRRGGQLLEREGGREGGSRNRVGEGGEWSGVSSG